MRRYLAGAVAVAVLLAACNDDKTKNPVAPKEAPTGPSFATSGSVGVNLDQWANGTATKTAEWQNGNLNGNNSTYGEGLVVPFRLAIEGLSAGQHFITIEHDFTAGGHKAYDFLTNADATELTIFNKICSAGGGAVSSFCGSSTTTMPGTVPYVDVAFLTDVFAGPTGKTVSGAIAASATAGTRKMRIYGISNVNQVSLSAMSHDGDFTGNSVAHFLVTFTPDVAGPVLMVWGGHLAESSYWDGAPNGASTISGSPWHMRSLNLDAGGASNQDRSIQPSAIQPPVLSIVKAANPVGPVNAGTDIGFDITVTNNGPGAAFNVVISDALPGKTGIDWNTATSGCSITGSPPNETLNCSIASLAQGATFTARVTSATTGACGLVTNSGATASAANADQVTSGSASVTINCPNVSISKSAVSATVSAGEDIAFDITVTNGGDAPAANVGFTDNLPDAGGTWSEVTDPDNKCSISGSTLTCSGITLAALTGSYTVRVKSGTTTAHCAAIENTANLSSPYSGLATASVTVQCPNVSIAKTAVSGTVNAGDNVQFDITVSNSGAGKAFNVGFTDALPSFGGTWSIASQDGTACQLSGSSLTCSGITLDATNGSYTVRVQSTTNGSVCTTVENTANLSSPYSGSSKASITVNCPNVGIAKSAVSGTVNAGQNVQFDITVSNTGLAPANNVGFTDNLPSFGGTWSEASDPDNKCSISGSTLTCSGISLAASTGSYTVRVQTTTDGSVCTTVENTANLSSPYSGSSKASATVNCPNVSIAKSAVSGTVNAGDDVGFSITVSNSGLAPASNVGFTDNLPNVGGTWSETSDPDNKCSISGSTLTCSGITLAASGGSYTVGVKSNTVKTSAAVCGTIENTANLSSPYSGSSKASVTINCPKATLTVTKTIVGGGSQLFDFTQDTPTNTSYQLTHLGSKVTSNLSAGTYRVCEKNLAVSWSATATLDGSPVTLINPEFNPDPLLNQDLGNRCVDVTLDYGDSKTVAWTNRPPPEGDSRTIGYWKNWSSCTGGGQYTKAVARNLLGKTLDGNLPQTVGILPLAGGTPSPDCQKAVYILDKSDLSGKKMASDPAYNLAAQLLAALLNKQSGAALCSVAAANIAAAQSLLAGINFNGTGTYLKKLDPAKAALANSLATKLEAYNSNKPSACV